MHDFEQYLEEDEQILYVSAKKNMHLKKMINMIYRAVILVVVYIFIFYRQFFVLKLIIMTIIVVVASLIIDKSSEFFKYKIAKSKQVHYCLTNKRAFRYDEHINELEYGYLKNYSKVSVNNVLQNIGTVIMEVDYSRNGENDLIQAQVIKQQLDEYPNKEDMHRMIFENIKDPEYVAALIRGNIDNEIDLF